jgi:kynurenine formamidase
MLPAPPPEAFTLVDVSHTVTDGLVTYRGLPAPVVCDFLSREASRGKYAPGTEFHIGRMELVGNTGTYVDAPSHRFAGGKDVSELALAQLAELPGLLVRVPPGAPRALGPDLFAALPPVRGCAVLVHTGWDRHFGTDAYFEGHPFLTEEAAGLLARGGAALVGIDSLNIDDTADGRRPVHTRLLGADVLVAEHLRGLEALPPAGFHFFAVPVKVRGMGTFPVRAFARVPRAGAPQG